jgi:hypothetical protein
MKMAWTPCFGGRADHHAILKETEVEIPKDLDRTRYSSFLCRRDGGASASGIKAYIHHDATCRRIIMKTFFDKK